MGAPLFFRPTIEIIFMGKTYKDQRDRQARQQKGDYVDALNRNWAAPSEDTAREFSRVVVSRERNLRDHGPHDGRRYGNKRNSQAVATVQGRRQERRKLGDPLRDAEGDIGLPVSPSKARKPRF